MPDNPYKIDSYLYWTWSAMYLNTVNIHCSACHGLCDYLPKWADPREWRD